MNYKKKKVLSNYELQYSEMLNIKLNVFTNVHS